MASFPSYAAPQQDAESDKIGRASRLEHFAKHRQGIRDAVQVEVVVEQNNGNGKTKYDAEGAQLVTERADDEMVLGFGDLSAEATEMGHRRKRVGEQTSLESFDGAIPEGLHAVPSHQMQTTAMAASKCRPFPSIPADNSYRKKRVVQKKSRRHHRPNHPRLILCLQSRWEVVAGTAIISAVGDRLLRRRSLLLRSSKPSKLGSNRVLVCPTRISLILTQTLILVAKIRNNLFFEFFKQFILKNN